MSARLCGCGCGQALSEQQRTYASRQCSARGSWAKPEYREKHAAVLVSRWAARKAERIADLRRQGAWNRFVRQWNDARLAAAWTDLEEQIDLDGLSREDLRRFQVWLAQLMRKQYLRAYQNGWRVGRRGGKPTVRVSADEGRAA